MGLLEEITKKKMEFLKLCKNHNIKSLYAFGSSITKTFNVEKSDIDFLIEVEEEDPLLRGENLLSVWDKFEEFFQRKVDLLTASSLKNPVLKRNIEATKILIYDGKRQKISF